MPRWLPGVLTRIRELAAARRVTFTRKAWEELAMFGDGLDERDACDILAGLAVEEARGRYLSAVTGEWLYVFKPQVAGSLVYVKVILRTDCIVVSFHADDGADDDDA